MFPELSARRKLLAARKIFLELFPTLPVTDANIGPRTAD